MALGKDFSIIFAEIRPTQPSAKIDDTRLYGWIFRDAFEPAAGVVALPPTEVCPTCADEITGGHLRESAAPAGPADDGSVYSCFHASDDARTNRQKFAARWRMRQPPNHVGSDRDGPGNGP